ncbi:MAG: hypothetical protein AB1426_06255 [Bacillota bacterium]
MWQRLSWWSDIFQRQFTDLATAVFGLGYGFPLIDFTIAGGITVREPHNSYISVLARLGVVGAFVFLWMHLLLLRVWHHAYKMCTRMRWRDGENRLLILMVFFILVWICAVGEDAFEKPFVTIPYYFFWGIVLRFAYHLKKGAIGVLNRE